MTTAADTDQRRWRGKTVLIAGASRGLGAALAAGLHAEGARVLAASRSGELPSALKRTPIEPLSVDLTDASALRHLAETLDRDRTTLDLLICSAFPPLQSARLHPNMLERLSRYISEASDMAVLPLAALLPLLNRSGGSAALVSSSAVTLPVRDWPHYIAAKRAAEAVFEMAPLQYSNIGSVIFRPEGMLTEMTNTPSARRHAEDPAVVAEHMITVLSDSNRDRSCRIVTAAELQAHQQVEFV